MSTPTRPTSNARAASGQSNPAPMARNRSRRCITCPNPLPNSAKLSTFGKALASFGGDNERGPLFGAAKVAHAPLSDHVDDRNEALPATRQPILDLGRHHGEILADDEAARHKGLELTAEDAWRDLLAGVAAAQQAAPDLAIAQRPVLEVPQD